jgi:hypothetical protein
MIALYIPMQPSSKDAEDRPLGAQLVRETAPNLVRVRREIAGLEVVHVARVVLDPARPDPLRDRVAGELPRNGVFPSLKFV